MVNQEKSDWEKAVDFHGHVCVGLALGYRTALAGLRELDSQRSLDEELLVIAEADNCSIDAIQVLTGCTMGKGNLFYRDYGKNVFTFGRRDTGKAVRIAVKGTGTVMGTDFPELRRKVVSGCATGEEQERFRALQAALPLKVLDIPEEELLDVREAPLEIPPRARIFNSVQCALCGESVMEPRARVQDGKPVCIPCSEQYVSRIRGR